jgi:FkbM family methyltransferase
MNVAVSSRFSITGISIPKFSTGLKNYYRAQCTSDVTCELFVLTMPIDSLEFCERIALIKIDVEGYELYVLDGIEKLMRRNNPILIIETQDNRATERLSFLGYIAIRLQKSPNILFIPKHKK